MSTLGRQYGLHLIKCALHDDTTSRIHPPVTESVRRLHDPQQGPEEQRRHIADIVTQNDLRDPMTDEVPGHFAQKVSLHQDMAPVAQIEEHAYNRDRGKKPVVGHDSMDPNTDEAWAEHEAFQPRKHTIIDYVPMPGPSV